MSGNGLEIRPLTPDRWDDFAELFGEKGAAEGCWCMFWRRTYSEWRRQAGDGNRAAFKAIVDAGTQPGLLAYRAGDPAGWCALGPRADFGRLQRSSTLAPIDGEPVWSIVCFFIDRTHRGTGVAAGLLRAAVAHAGERGARIVEGYPYDPGTGRADNASAYTGVIGMFREAGFQEAARRGKRVIMRAGTQ